MKRILLVGGFVFLVATTVAAQTAKPTSEAPRRPTQTRPGGAPIGNEPGALTQQVLADRELVLEAARGGIAEVALGRLAVQKATDPAVRQFGQQMVDAHTKTNGELQPLAKAKRFTLPTEESAAQKATLDRLSKLSGAPFNQALMSEMVGKHTRERALIQRLAQKANDPDLRAWGTRTLPSVQEHQKMANDITLKLVGLPPKTPKAAKAK